MTDKAGPNRIGANVVVDSEVGKGSGGRGGHGEDEQEEEEDHDLDEEERARTWPRRRRPTRGMKRKRKKEREKGGGSEGGECSESTASWDTLLMAFNFQSAEENEVGFSAPQLLE